MHKPEKLHICKRCNTHVKVRCQNEAAYKCFICAQKIPLRELEVTDKDLGEFYKERWLATYYKNKD